MQAGRATTGNYYGALRTDASDGTAETDIPESDHDPLPEGYLHHLPSEVLAIVLHYLTTAARIPFCDAGDRLRLTRMTRRLDGLCEARLSLSCVCREWRAALGDESGAAAWASALFGLKAAPGWVPPFAADATRPAERDFARRRVALRRASNTTVPGIDHSDKNPDKYGVSDRLQPEHLVGLKWPLQVTSIRVIPSSAEVDRVLGERSRLEQIRAAERITFVVRQLTNWFPGSCCPDLDLADASIARDLTLLRRVQLATRRRDDVWLCSAAPAPQFPSSRYDNSLRATISIEQIRQQPPRYEYYDDEAEFVRQSFDCGGTLACENSSEIGGIFSCEIKRSVSITAHFSLHGTICEIDADIIPFMTSDSDFSRSCGCRDCERDFAEYDRAFQGLGEDDQFFANRLLQTHGIVEALKYVRKKIWSPRPPRFDPAQRRICSFFPRLDGRARCWTCGGQHE